jgi:hypothetical protein
MKFSTKSKFSIGGYMSEKGADKAGFLIAKGVAFFAFCAGVAVVIAAVAYLIK